MKVDALVATYRQFNSEAFGAIQRMFNRSRQEGIDLECPALHGNALVHRARNQALLPIRPDADFVLLCDDDMHPEPDALVRLLAHDADVASGLCTTRGLPVKLAISAYSREKDWMCPIGRFRPGALLIGEFGAGTAFMLIRRSVLDQALEFHLAGHDWLADNRETLDRLHVRTEKREQERLSISAKRRSIWGKKRYARVFYYAVHDDQEEFGEDHTLCRNLIRMGVPITIDTGVPVGHIGDFPYGPWNLEDHDPKEMKLAEFLYDDEPVAQREKPLVTLQ